MIEMDVRPQGVDRVLAWLRRGVHLEDVVARELGQWASDLTDSKLYGMENYAPPPANSKYIRTGRLGSNWGVRRTKRTAVEFYNMTPYAAYVVGDGKGGRQAGIHAGRWWLGRKRIIEAMPDGQKRIYAGIRKALR